MGLTHIMHTSYSSTNEHNKFRVIMPLKETVEPSKWTNVYKAAVEWFKDLFGTTLLIPQHATPRARTLPRTIPTLLKARIYRL